MKPGGHFCVSDVVIKGELSGKMKKDAEMYAGCVAGAIDIQDYLQIIEQSGFINVTVHKERAISIPEKVLLEFLTQNEMSDFVSGKTGIFSITISGHKGDL